MELFATDRDRLAFLLETDAALDLDFETLEAQAKEAVTDEASPAKRPKYITNYIGSKQKLVDWIWKHTPEGVGSVLDAFSGSAVVAYMYKTKGLRVLANDRLRYCYHAARAIVENRNVRLTDEELGALLAGNAKAGSFIRDNFKGIFFAKGVHGLIDTIRANIDKLSGFKKDIALFALGKTCMSGKGGFGHFSSSTRYGKREDTPEEFKERFRKNVVRINALVFDNGKECKAHRKDVNGLLSEVRVDLAYFDPPYATEFSTTNYEKSYHFVEGLMTYWDGLTLVEGSKTKHYKTDHQTVTRANAKEFFETFLGNAQHIPNWLISYRDHAYPNEREMRGIITTHGFEPAMRSRDHHYSITSRHGDASHAKERLFICKHRKGRSAKADATAASIKSQAVWEETENEIRYRAKDPKQFDPDSFRRKSLDGVDGVSIIIGRFKKEFVPENDNPRSMVLQAYRFVRKTERNPDGWTIEKAKEWIKEHEASAATEAALRVEENICALADAPLGDSLNFFLSMEAVGLGSYVLAGYMRFNLRSTEAGLKYVLFGAVSSAIMLYGLSLLYGLTGSMDFMGIREVLMTGRVDSFSLLVTVILIFAGFSFKVAAVPFHFWCPDVYHGAPTPVSALFSVGPKAAGFALMIRFFYSTLAVGPDTLASAGLIHQINWPLLLSVIAAVTMTFGNLVALRQDNVKRMLAYSSIAHVGYLLMGFVLLSSAGLAAILFYLLVYTLMNLGAFFYVTAINNHIKSEELSDYVGIGFRAPWAGAMMVIFMASLTGVPPFAGFIGKFYLFTAAMDTELYWLVIVAGLNSVIGLYYYFKVVKAMFLMRPAEDADMSPLKLHWLQYVVLAVMAIPTLALGIFFGEFSELADAAVGLLTTGM